MCVYIYIYNVWMIVLKTCLDSCLVPLSRHEIAQAWWSRLQESEAVSPSCHDSHCGFSTETREGFQKLSRAIIISRGGISRPMWP